MQIHIYLEGLAAPVTSIELPDDPNGLVRGRNGWFRPRQIMIWRGVRITIAVRSRRPGDSAPIQLHLAPAVAHALGSALLLAAAPADNSSASSMPHVERPLEHTEVT
jgi:hypothetical protein